MLFWDCGNSYGKARDSFGKEMKVLSLTSKSQDTFTEKKLWKIDGQYIGEDAIIHGNTQDFSLDQIKTEQSTFKTLTKYILCNYPNENKIVFLFPFESYFSEKKKIESMFSQDMNIIYYIGEEPKVHSFKPELIKSLPQGYCAGMDYFLDENGKTIKEIPNVVLIVDIGFGTVNYIYLLRGTLVREMSKTTDNGMHQIYRRFTQGHKIYEIDLYNGYKSLNPLYPDLTTLIKSDITTLYNHRAIDQFVFVGGGADAVFEYIPWNNKILHSGQFTNVRGASKAVKNLSWGKLETSETMIS